MASTVEGQSVSTPAMHPSSGATTIATRSKNNMSFNNCFPAEIREHIFLMAVYSLSAPSQTSSSSPRNLPTLQREPQFTRVCRLWRAESLPLYYRHHHFSVLAPLRLSSYGEMYNPMADSQRAHILPTAEILRKVKKLRVQFLVDRFAWGGDVRFSLDIDMLDGLSRRERESRADRGNAKYGWIVSNGGVDARNMYDPSEWRERARLLVRYLETVLEDEFGLWKGLGLEGTWGQSDTGVEENFLTRGLLKQFLCVDLREQSDGTGHPLWM